jgi:hypothetical protein
LKEIKKKKKRREMAEACMMRSCQDLICPCHLPGQPNNMYQDPRVALLLGRHGWHPNLSLPSALPSPTPSLFFHQRQLPGKPMSFPRMVAAGI